MEELTPHKAKKVQGLAKISRPKATHLLDRPHLFAALEQSQQQTSIWITAPPGFGKSSLASSYVEHSGTECLWYRIDESDADCGSFFHYLCQAGDHFSGSDQDLPHFTSSDLLGLGAFARRFFENLYLRFRRQAVLVFDDCQSVAGDALLHTVLARAVESLPDDVQIFFLSREQPPSAYARLRTHGVMGHLGADALRFSLNETKALASQSKTLLIDQTALSRMHELTDGWVAGLRLFLKRCDLSLLENMPESDTKQVLFDYFSEEIFLHLDPEVQRILLKCSLLSEISAQDAEQLTLCKTAPQSLEELSQKNYFTTRHEGQEPLYQFHPLFRAFLLERASAHMPPATLRALKSEAAQLLLQRGRGNDAVGLLCACEDWPRLQEIILTHADMLSRQGRLQTLASWIEPLPEETVEASPWLLFWLGCCQVPADPATAKSTLVRAYALFDRHDNPTGLYLCWAAVASTFFLLWSPSQVASPWITKFEELQRRHPQFPNRAIEVQVVVGVVSLLRTYRLDHRKLPYWLNRCEGLLESIGDNSTRLMAVSELAWSFGWLGRIDQGIVLMQMAGRWINDDATPLARLSALSACAIYALHQGEMSRCADIVSEALGIADETEVHLLDPVLCMWGVYAALAVGDLGMAQGLLPRVGAEPAQCNIDSAIFHHIHLLVTLHEGRLERAARHGREVISLCDHIGFQFNQFVSRLCLASVLLECGQLDEANEHLKYAAQVAHTVDSASINNLFLLAQALFALKRGKQALVPHLLQQAISNAKAGGQNFTPIFARDTLAELYALGLENGIDAPYLQNQIRCQRLVPQSPESAPEQWPWPIRIYTLGRFVIARDDSLSRTRSGRKPVELLKSLIALGGQNVVQDNLIDALWPEVDGDHGKHNLETTLYRLRMLIGPESLHLKDGLLSLNLNHCWVDCYAFEYALTQVRELVSTKDAVGISAAGERLLKLYQGSFLGHDQHLPHVAIYTERLRNRLLRAIDLLGAYWAENGQFEKEKELYALAVDVEPRSERFYYRLMNYYYRLGDYPEAITVYQRCRIALHSALQVEPSAEMASLHAAVLAAANGRGQG